MKKKETIEDKIINYLWKHNKYEKMYDIITNIFMYVSFVLALPWALISFIFKPARKVSVAIVKSGFKIFLTFHDRYGWVE